jgi:hypothetical protein
VAACRRLSALARQEEHGTRLHGFASHEGRWRAARRRSRLVMKEGERKGGLLLALGLRDHEVQGLILVGRALLEEPLLFP